MVMKIIDRANGLVIQKLTKPDGTLVRFQVTDEVLTANSVVTPFKSLAEARLKIGSKMPPTILTKAKSEYAHNTKGYRHDTAHRGR